jgi:hypothetical protein
MAWLQIKVELNLFCSTKNENYRTRQKLIFTGTSSIEFSRFEKMFMRALKISQIRHVFTRKAYAENFRLQKATWKPRLQHHPLNLCFQEDLPQQQRHPLILVFPRGLTSTAAPRHHLILVFPRGLTSTTAPSFELVFPSGLTSTAAPSFETCVSKRTHLHCIATPSFETCVFKSTQLDCSAIL